MRTIALACALLALVSCGGENEEAKKEKVALDAMHKPFGGGDTNSPIIISDGSMHLNHGHHFEVRGAKKATLKLRYFTPRGLGYQCDSYTAGNCTSTCNAAGVTPHCSVDLTSASAWTLALDASPDAATLTYPGIADSGSTDPSRIDIAFKNKGVTVQDGKVKGVDLVQSNTLNFGTLSIGGKSYKFTCPPNAECIQISMVCPLLLGCSQDQ